MVHRYQARPPAARRDEPARSAERVLAAGPTDLGLGPALARLAMGRRGGEDPADRVRAAGGCRRGRGEGGQKREAGANGNN